MTKDKIVKRLLKEAQFYWGDPNDISSKAAQQGDFDPVVERIFEANAVEIEKLYRELEDSNNEIIQGLCKVLVPDEIALPEPGYTLVKITPEFAQAKISPENIFEVEGQDDTGEPFNIYFSSLFNHKIPNWKLQYIFSEAFLWDVSNHQPEDLEVDNFKAPNYDKVKEIWLGFNVDRISKMEEDDLISMFLGNQIFDEFDPHFISFQTATWTLGMDKYWDFEVKKGLSVFKDKEDPQKIYKLSDVLGIIDNYEKKIFNRFRNSLVSLTNLPHDLSPYLQPCPPGYEHLALGDMNPVLWIKASFPMDIPKSFFEENPLYINCIPIVNRKLISKNVTKQDYDRLLLPMPTENHFLGVNRIWDDQYQDNTYKEIEFFTSSAKPGNYILRKGNRVRRITEQHASIQINKLLDLIYDEAGIFRESGVNRLNEDFKVIDQAIKRIRNKLPSKYLEEQNKTEYYGVAHIRKRASLIYYNYWECQGEEIQKFNKKIKLSVYSNEVSMDGSFTIIPIQSGKGVIEEENYFKHLKSSIVSRNRIVTQGDIEIFCKSQYGNIIGEIDIENKVLPSNKDLFKMERVVLVSIKLKQPLEKEEENIFKASLQNELNALSAFFSPVKIAIRN
ncbi:MAG: type VI secretion system baseplate subunit TssF [Bacteroidetes bacterium]|nr:type VI secretion system baseplate subunit TssF [Bacteroidota bacterium]